MIIRSFDKFLFLVFIGAIAYFYYLQFPSFFDYEKCKTQLNEFGDFVGGTLNPVFSFIGLILLFETYSMQKKELKETKKALRIQNQTQSKQQFESTFFALLNVHNQGLQSFLDYKETEGSDGCKRDFFKLIFNQALEKNSLKSAKEQFETGNPMFGHYFRILYQLLKFIFTELEDGKINKKDTLIFRNDIRLADKNNDKASDVEKKYSNIIRALLPDDVMKFLVVNCYCENENDIYWEYKLLLERYDFFEHASFNPNNPSSKSVIEQYPVLKEAQEFYKKAFGL